MVSDGISPIATEVFMKYFHAIILDLLVTNLLSLSNITDFFCFFFGSFLLFQREIENILFVNKEPTTEFD